MLEKTLRRVPETLSKEVLEKMGAVEAHKQQTDLPICTVDELGKSYAIIFGTLIEKSVFARGRCPERRCKTTGN